MTTPPLTFADSAKGAPALVKGPIGRCIYCGTTEGNLGKEHVMPYGMQGQLILAKSSCLNCSKITSGLENFVLGQMLVQQRIRYGLRSRKKGKSRRPDIFELDVCNMDGSGRKKNIGRDYLPWFAWALPIYDLPGYIRQCAPESCKRGEIRVILSKMDAEAMLSFGNGRQSVSIPSHYYDEDKFTRFLAKVAHSYAISMLGEHAFKPCLNDLILNGHPYPNFWVGSEPECPAYEPYLFEVSLGAYKIWSGEIALAVRIRLFSFLGTPAYVVFVGTPADGVMPVLPEGYGMKVSIMVRNPDGSELFSVS